MNEVLDKKIKKQGLISGLILGFILAVIAILYFYFMVTMAKGAVAITVGSVIFTYVLPIGLAVLFCLNLRKQIGGFWDMRQASTGIFIMFFVSYLVVYIVKDQLFAKVIEPNMVQKTETAMLDALDTLKKNSPENKKAADEKIVEMKQAFDAEKTVTIGQQIQSLGITIIFLFVLSLIFAAFFKREYLVYDPATVNDNKV